MARKNLDLNVNQIIEEEQQNVVPVTFTQKKGRPFSNRTCSKKDGKSQTIYLVAEDKALLSDCAYFAHVDQQDIIRVALRRFLDEYAQSGRLTDKGVAIVEQYKEDTTI